MTIDPRFERSVRRWLRAYPRRWRRERADEMTALLADLAQPDATRLGVRTGLGLVRAGWATRARTRPPLRHVLAYRLLDRRVPAPYRAWARDDIEGEGSPVRVLLSVAAVLAIVLVVLPLVTGGSPHGPSGSTVGALLGMSIGILTRGPRMIRNRARKHLVPDAGEEVTSDTLLFGWVLRDRVAARGTAGLVAISLSVAGVAAAAAYLVAPTALASGPCGPSCVETISAARDGAPPTIVLAVALVAGLLAAFRARRLLRRLVPLRNPQHSRRIIAPTPRHRAIAVVATACAVGIAWLEGSGRADLFFAVGIAVVVLVGLPVALVARHVAQTGPDDLALVDVRTIAVRGKLPPVDTFQESLVPALLATD
jgi:hypothetical protein